MTRETKIGLLVGLAFIIVIGILLSDHVTTSVEPPQAPLSNAGGNVRQGIETPSMAGAQPPISHAPAPGEQVQVAPQQPVPTGSEVAPAPEPVQIVEVTGPGTNTQQPQAQASNTHQSGPAPAPERDPVAMNNDREAVTHTPTPTNTQTPQPMSNDPIAEVARQHGEPVVAVGENQGGNEASRRGREYVAQPGDTLSKMAGRLMGKNTRANRQAIINANPSLIANPNLIVAGRTYIIPVVSSDDAATASATEPARRTNPAPTNTTTVTPPTPPRSDTAAHTYVTKERDTLWGIAEAQLGNGKLWTMIRDMNQDVLKGSEHIRPGMTLRLPPRAVASAE